jgi:hypothetical protein
MAEMSVTRPPGLAMDSMKIALVLSVMALSNDEMSSMSAHTTFQPNDLNEWLKALIEPP